jgi:hypothetical protein
MKWIKYMRWLFYQFLHEINLMYVRVPGQIVPTIE